MGLRGSRTQKNHSDSEAIPDNKEMDKKGMDIGVNGERLVTTAANVLTVHFMLPSDQGSQRHLRSDHLCLVCPIKFNAIEYWSYFTCFFVGKPKVP